MKERTQLTDIVPCCCSSVNWNEDSCPNVAVISHKWVSTHSVHIHSFISDTPLNTRSAKRRHQSPEWTIWSHVDCFVQDRLLDFRSCWIVFIHIVQGCRGGLLQFSKHEAAKIFLASASSGICTMWLNREKSCAWATAKRCGCSVVPLTASFHTWWYHLIPNSFHRHHWSTASLWSSSCRQLMFINETPALKSTRKDSTSTRWGGHRCHA